jgi:hypothetical protein
MLPRQSARVPTICAASWRSGIAISWRWLVGGEPKRKPAPEVCQRFQIRALLGPSVLPDPTSAASRPALKAYRFKKGSVNNPGGLSRFYYQCRQIFQENAPELARAAIELALDPETDQRVRSVLIVAGLDRAGVKPIDYAPAQDVTPPTWDPGALTSEGARGPERRRAWGALAMRRQR